MCLKLFFLFSYFITVNGYFTLVGPRTHVFGTKYEVFITNNHGKSNLKLNLELKGSKADEVWEKSIDLDFRETLEAFELEDHPTIENFTLTAKILNTNYQQSIKIFTIDKKFTALIQTDKAVYKPEDLVQFRILLLDSEAKPYQTEIVNVVIIDSNGVVVYESEYDDENLKKDFAGVFSGEFLISDSPPLGQWTISITADGSQETAQNFEVSEYILPRFEVKIESLDNILRSQNKVRITFHGDYTFGDYVEGTANISVKTAASADKLQVTNFLLTKAAKVVSKKYVDFDILRDLRLNSSGVIQVDVSIEEKMTGKIANSSKFINVFEKAKNSIQMITKENKIKPGFPFSVEAIVRKFDGSLENDTNNKVTFKITFLNSRPEKAEKMLARIEIPFVTVQDVELVNGVAEYTFDVPKSSLGMIVEATYLDIETSLNISRFPSQCKEYLRAEIVKENPPVEGSILIKVKSSRILEDPVYYFISGSMNVMIHKKLNQAKDKEEFEIKLNITPELTTSAKIVIYYIHRTGEIIFDQLELESQRNLKNFLNISLPHDQVSPGSEVELSFQSVPKSFVGILAVDKSVLLHKTGNDIDKNRILNLLRFDPSAGYEPLVIDGSESRYLEFGGSNSFILTDALNEPQPKISSRFNDVIESDENDYEDIFNHDWESEEVNTNEKDVSGHLRKNFPETWLFSSFSVDESGRFVLQKHVPDTITSWVVTGFSLDQENGLGLSEPESLFVRQKLFIKLNLPYSIRWGEILKVEISVFNYVPDRKINLSVNVELFRDENDPDFEFIDSKSKCVFQKSSDNMRQKLVSIAQNSMSTISFLIKPLKIGKIKLNVKAVGQQVKIVDAVEKEIVVESEGVTHFDNNPILVDLSSGNFQHDYQLSLLDQAIPKSVKIGIAIDADIMGKVLLDVSNLIKIPRGCGEQRLVGFVPIIAATNYLNYTNRLSPSQKANNEKILRVGYNQMLDRKNRDGSYNLWGYEKSDSIWLTAYILKCLGHVKHWISINKSHIHDAMKFLASKQSQDGGFNEYGPISNRRIQGGVKTSLTAYVAISFLENSDYRTEYKSVIDKALDLIDKNLFSLSDNYGLAISAYALVLANYPRSDNILRTLKQNALFEEGLMYWENKIGSQKDESDSSLTLKIEISSYALLAFLKSGDEGTAIRIMKWLISKRNSEGGFYSTQDTVMGLQALGEIAKVLYKTEPNMQISVRYENEQHTFNVDKATNLTRQELGIPSSVRFMTINGIGTGKALINIWKSYNVKSPIPSEVFKVSLDVQSGRNGGVFYLTACVKYLPNRDIKPLNMVIMEIALPSGYVYDSDSTESLREFNIKKVETQSGKSFVVLYFDEIPKIPTCPEIRAIREQKLEILKSSSVKVYDYYHPEYQTVNYYTINGEQGCPSQS